MLSHVLVICSIFYNKHLNRIKYIDEQVRIIAYTIALHQFVLFCSYYSYVKNVNVRNKYYNKN